MKRHSILTRLTTLFMMLLGTATTISPHPALALATIWQFPLGGDGYTYATKAAEKYGTTVINTNFNVRNLELISSGTNHVTCFRVGWHTIFHTGVDFYRQGASSEGAPVQAVADGTVFM